MYGNMYPPPPAAVLSLLRNRPHRSPLLPHALPSAGRLCFLPRSLQPWSKRQRRPLVSGPPQSSPLERIMNAHPIPTPEHRPHLKTLQRRLTLLIAVKYLRASVLSFTLFALRRTRHPALNVSGGVLQCFTSLPVPKITRYVYA